MGLLPDDESVERSDIHRTTRLTLPPERPHVLLIEPICVAPDLHSPRLQTVARKTKLRVRNPELGRPSQRIDLRSGLPDRIPRRIAVELIAANPRGIVLEPRLVDVVVVRVENDDELVGRERIERAVVSVRVEKLVAPRKGSANTTSAQRVVHARADVDRALVIEDSHFGSLGRRDAFNRVLLPKLGNWSSLRPRALIELAIDGDRSCD